MSNPDVQVHHHPVFSRFSPYRGAVEPGYDVDFIGARTRHEFQPSGTMHSPPVVSLGHPCIDEEYFEWIDILESVVLADDPYTIAELGAGYGRWAVRAALAARQQGKPLGRFIAVEPEPVHFRWLETHFADNGLDPRTHRLERAAVGDQPGETMFWIGTPDETSSRPNEWYGQAIANETQLVANARQEMYEGWPVVRHPSGMRSITVPVRTFAALLADTGVVDLADLDLQGEEHKVVRSSIAQINESVRRLHIGTHGPQQEEELRRVLRENRWECRADYACGSQSDTPYGRVAFQDGVQSWINPRL
jgi:FkbM family methyltransferase